MCKGFQQNERERLKIKAFYLRLSLSNPRSSSPLPDSLTLYYLPRINGSPLEICDSKIQPDSPGFVTLHRLVSGEGKTTKAAIFGSRERVKACEGARFEVYLRDEKVLKGIFRKDEDDEWKMECRCALEREMVGVQVTEAEISVAVEGQEVAMSEKVEVVVRRKRRAKYCFQGLEEIPEEREVDTDESDGGGGGGGCCCCSDEIEMGSDDGGDRGEETEMETEMGWAVDVGIWVMCLGVGYLVSKASSKSLRRGRLL